MLAVGAVVVTVKETVVELVVDAGLKLQADSLGSPTQV
jgi:hypothetical protein